jgi:Ca-activated chloride channel family protein
MKALRQLGVSVLVLTLAASAAWACRIIPIWPPHPPHPPHPPRPIPMPPPALRITTKSHHFEIEVTDRMAQVTVEAVFHNPNGRQIEGEYIFPIEKGAVVRNFSMWVNGKELKADLLPADQARQIYEDIVRRRKDPALLEYMDSALIRCRIFPIAAHSDVKVKLRYGQLLRSDSGLTYLGYALRSAKPDDGKVGTLSGKITIRTSRPLTSVTCPTHKMEVKRPDERTAVLGMEASNYLPERDVRVFFGQSESDVDVGLVSQTEPGEDGYFLLTIAPTRKAASKQVSAKNILFVIDTSGSMSGKKIRQAREALKFCLKNLNARDTFNVITFSTTTSLMFRQMIEATKENVELALERAGGIEAGGGTAIDAALKESLEMIGGKEGVKYVVFLTDGLPTIGETDVGRILQRVKRREPSDVRVFAFGVGYDVNTDLLDNLAAMTGGTEEYVTEDEDLELKVSSFYTKIANPVLSDVKLAVQGVEVSDFYPSPLPDLFKGSELSVLGRFRSPGKATVVLSGKMEGETRAFEYSVDFAKRTENDFLPSLWAYRKIAFLLREIRLHGMKDELKDEVVRLGKRYGIMTPYTSFLVVEEQEARQLGLEGRRRELEEATTGRGAVRASKGLADAAKAAQAAPAPMAAGERLDLAGGWGMDEKNKEVLAKRIEERLKTAGDRSFALNRQDGYFYDTTYDEDTCGKPMEVKWYSDEFFQLMRDVPELRRYLYETGKIVVCVRGKCYKFVE